MVWGGEEEVGAGGRLDRLVAVKLGAVVDGDGADATRGSSDEFDSAAVGGVDGTSLEFANDGEAGLTVDEGEEAVRVSTEHGVALEVTDTGAVVCAGRSLRDWAFVGEASPGVIAAVAFAAFLVGTSEVAVAGGAIH